MGEQTAPFTGCQFGFCQSARYLLPHRVSPISGGRTTYSWKACHTPVTLSNGVNRVFGAWCHCIQCKQDMRTFSLGLKLHGIAHPPLVTLFHATRPRRQNLNAIWVVSRWQHSVPRIVSASPFVAQMSSAPQKCPDASAPNHLDTSAQSLGPSWSCVSLELFWVRSVPTFRRCRNVLWPKCPVTCFAR